MCEHGVVIACRDAPGPINALFGIQALDIMRFQIGDGEFDCIILAQGGGAIARFQV